MLWDFEDDDVVKTDDLPISADTIKSAAAGGSRKTAAPLEITQPQQRAQRKTRPAEAPERRRLAETRPADDLKLVKIPQPRRGRTAAWLLGTVFALLLIGFQLRHFYLDDLAQISALRPALAGVCEYISCSVPPRSDLESIDLLGTSVNPHPEVPGALRVSVNLMNRATFEQAYPLLEITLTDKAGEVVGRRTYVPKEYGISNQDNLSPRVVKRVDLDLATPTERAVGYEIQLVAR